MSLARSKRIGESVEAVVIQRIDELAPESSRDAHVDATVETTIDASAALPTVGLPVLEAGTGVEIKSCGVVLASQRRGRYKLRQTQHEYLLDESAVYLFVVTPPHDSTPLALKVVPATVVDGVISGWVETERRSPYAQVSWGRFFDAEELDPDAGGDR